LQHRPHRFAPIPLIALACMNASLKVTYPCSESGVLNGQPTALSGSEVRVAP
jgi:hypothetical protein